DPDLRYVARVLENRRREAGGIDTKANREAPSGSRAPVSKRVLGEYYAYLRAEAEEQQRRHIAEAKERIAGMSDILALEREFARAIVNFDFSPKAKDERKTQLAKRKELEEQKQRLLRENGYPEDYLDLQYRCEICRDTGVTDDGVFCSCTQARAQEAYTWNSKRTTNG
ncbi:MAG: hypothetical protein IJH77_03840, partial [Mogibacterium sp.]|nr:hypothetical protein [Mogibacterium sp.]